MATAFADLVHETFETPRKRGPGRPPKRKPKPARAAPVRIESRCRACGGNNIWQADESGQTDLVFLECLLCTRTWATVHWAEYRAMGRG